MGDPEKGLGEALQAWALHTQLFDFSWAFWCPCEFTEGHFVGEIVLSLLPY